MSEEKLRPKLYKDTFECPLCGAYTLHRWKTYSVCGSNSAVRLDEALPIGALYQPSGTHINDSTSIALSYCVGCNKYILWNSNGIIYPIKSSAPNPVNNMPNDVKNDYVEAKNVFEASPKSACALLRLAIQKLCVHLGEKGKDLNTDIGNLVKKGLPEKIQKALDVVRVIGNNAVHPSVINIDDNRDIALSLFKWVNIIVSNMITDRNEIDELFNNLPNTSKQQITNRDK